MKATGIVRRIDDLGRVVIPKEIRRTMGIREGDPLEIYTDRDGCVIFKKYVAMNEASDTVQNIYNGLKSQGIKCAIYNSDYRMMFGDKSFPTDFDEYELQEMEGRYITIKSGEDIVGYIFATADTTEAQKTCIKMAATILTAELGG